MKWAKERVYNPPENDQLSEEYGLYLIIFFAIFSAIMIGLYILIICCGFYKSLNETSRKVYRDYSCPREEV